MQLASSVIFCLLTLLPGHASLTGVWRLDKIKSDFGGADAPRRLVLYLQQDGNHLSATILIADANGQRLSYGECRVEAQPGSSLSCVLPDSTEEIWQVTVADELTISRVLSTKSRPIRQRLVLARASVLE
jgi:hypothetical protein